jgi:hypothetical protein
MGAEFQTMTVDGILDRKAVGLAFAKAQDQDRYSNGHEYSGGFGMADGLTFVDAEFGNHDMAYRYLDDHCKKWEAAQAVKYLSDDGTKTWLIGAWCAF